MNVHDFVLKIIGDLYKAKKATHDNEVGFELPAPTENALTEFLKADALVALNNFSGDACEFCSFEAFDVGPIGNSKYDFDGKFTCLRKIDQVLHGGTRPTQQNCNAQWFHDGCPEKKVCRMFLKERIVKIGHFRRGNHLWNDSLMQRYQNIPKIDKDSMNSDS